MKFSGTFDSSHMVICVRYIHNHTLTAVFNSETMEIGFRWAYKSQKEEKHGIFTAQESILICDGVVSDHVKHKMIEVIRIARTWATCNNLLFIQEY